MINCPQIYLIRRDLNFSIEPSELKLNPLELERLSKISSNKKKNEFLSSRMALQLVLENKLSLKMESFVKDKFGRPYLRSSSMGFSMSHSGPWIAFLFIDGEKDIGIDIETKAAESSYLQIAERYFSKNELDWILQVEDITSQSERFRKLWSLKEAYYKACGENAMEAMMALKFDLEKSRFESEKGCFLSHERPEFCLSLYKRTQTVEFIFNEFEMSESGLTPVRAKNINMSSILPRS